jgi:hypothetical protein
VSEVQAVVADLVSALPRRRHRPVRPVVHARGLDAPVLVVHGDRATVRLEPDGDHSCNDLATVARPAVADRVTDRQESAHA